MHQQAKKSIPDGLSRLPVYMDHHATTPVDPRVVEAMLPYFNHHFGNAASIDHEYGAEAARAVEHARVQVARLIKARPDEIIFTSGATESDNLAILGTAKQYSNKGKHIITCVTEHKAVLDSCQFLAGEGWDITYLAVDQYGFVNPADVRGAITNETVLISVMVANNEIGTVAPIADIGRIAHECEVLFHTDATQAVGYLDIDVDAMGIDLLSLSAHKIYGPQGVGALFVRKRHPRVRLQPQVHGGGHQRGIRSGTLNLPGIVGLGKAAELARKEREVEAKRVGVLRDQLLKGLKAELDCVDLNGHPSQRLSNNLSVAFTGIESKSLLVQLKHDVALSTGSACTTAKVEPSHVILALGFGETRAHQSVRFGLGRENTEADVEFVMAKLCDGVLRLRRFAFAS